MTGVFIQARMGSTRLPGKALLTLAGRPVLEWVLAAMKSVSADVHAVVTDAESAPVFATTCLLMGYELFEGDPEDVLARYCAAAERFGVETVVRATGDNPLLSFEMAQKSLEEHRALGADYTTYRSMPAGTGVEIIQAAALHAANARTSSRFDREHVTPYIYSNPKDFSCHTPDNPITTAFRESHVSIDTTEDYRQILAIIHELRPNPGSPPEPITFHELLDWLNRNETSTRARRRETRST